MRIVADPTIAFVSEAFSTLGEVSLIPGRAWTSAEMRTADILLIRSAIRIDARLLEGSQVKFVGTATSGIDHVDRDYLKRQGIAFASAPGSNANSVAEYVVSAILALASQRGWRLAQMSAGIIGCGHVGSRVVQLLEALGIACVVNDPPLKDLTAEARFLELDEVIAADIVSLHVPLTREGRYPTLRLLDECRLARLKPDALVINTARGGVVDEQALIEQLDKRPSITAVVDCWAHEPAINTALLHRVNLGTPHIAGYSFDGKVRATEMLYWAACEYFGLPPRWQASLPTTQPLELKLSSNASEVEILTQMVLACYDVREDAKVLKRLFSLPHTEQPGHFDSLRAHYPVRREFNQTQLIIPALGPRLEARVRALGFQNMQAC